MLNKIIFIILIGILAFQSLKVSLSFDFTSEDFYSMWYPYHGLKYETFHTIMFKDHPIDTYQHLLLMPFFGLKPFLWHAFGILIKIVNSLLVTLIIYKLTLSKKAAIFSGLIFASSAIGLASYIWTHEQAPALEIIPMLLGFYFWMDSYYKPLLNYKYILSVILFLLAVYGDFGRGFVIIPLAILWDILTAIQNSKKIVSLNLFLRTGIISLLAITLVFLTQINSRTTGSMDVLVRFTDYFFHYPLTVAMNFLYGIGPVMVGWFLPLWEINHQTNKDSISLIGGIFLLAVTILTGILKIPKRDKIIYLFLLAWIPANFFIGWSLRGMYLGTWLPGITHRYLLIPSIGLVGILGLLLSRFVIRINLFLLILMILAINLIRSNQILSEALPYLSYETHQAFWDQVDREIPNDKKNLIFYFVGYEPILSQLVYSYSVPFALRRGINNINEVPITTNDRELIKNLLCKENVEVKNALNYGVTNNDMRIQKKPIPLDNLYAWKYKDNNIIEATNEQRKQLKQEVDCLRN